MVEELECGAAGVGRDKGVFFFIKWAFLALWRGSVSGGRGETDQWKV